MGASAIGTLNKVSYRYVLSVIDVSDGTLNWLHAVSEKKRYQGHLGRTAEYLLEHGLQYLVQSDQGDEFKGAIKRLCRLMNIKLIKLQSTLSSTTEGKDRAKP